MRKQDKKVRRDVIKDTDSRRWRGGAAVACDERLFHNCTVSGFISKTIPPEQVSIVSQNWFQICEWNV